MRIDACKHFLSAIGTDTFVPTNHTNMKTQNKTQLVGYLGNEPVIKECKNGNMLAMLRLATHDRIKSEDTDPL